MLVFEQVFRPSIVGGGELHGQAIPSPETSSGTGAGTLEQLDRLSAVFRS